MGGGGGGAVHVFRWPLQEVAAKWALGFDLSIFNMFYNKASMLYIPIEHADDVKNYSSSCCELSNPPKTSPKYIHNSAVNNEAFTMCFQGSL